MPAIPADAVAAQHARRATASARWLLWRRAISRTITPRQNGRADSKSAAFDAVVADVRVGEGDDLAGVATGR